MRILQRLKALLKGTFPLHPNATVERLQAFAELQGVQIDVLKETNEDLRETNNEFLRANQRLVKELEDARTSRDEEHEFLRERFIRGFAATGELSIPFATPYLTKEERFEEVQTVFRVQIPPLQVSHVLTDLKYLQALHKDALIATVATALGSAVEASARRALSAPSFFTRY